MPSSKKTPNLFLNKWLGADKPKKDDFNEDNEILDRAVGDLQGQVTRVEAGQQALEQKIGDDLLEAAGDLGRQLEELTGEVSVLDDELATHSADSLLHLMTGERNRWNAMGPVVGAYTGDGMNRQRIALGFKPAAGFVFALGQPLVSAVWLSQTCDVWSAMLCRDGGSQGVALGENGFDALSGGPNSSGHSYRLNDSGVGYFYVMWR